MARAGKIFAFGIVATVIILLGVVSSRVASPSRASSAFPTTACVSAAPRAFSRATTPSPRAIPTPPEKRAC